MSDQLERSVGSFIVDRYTRLGFTQAAFARRAGLSDTTIREIERGDIRRRRDSTLTKLSLALKLPPAGIRRLLDGEDPEDVTSRTVLDSDVERAVEFGTTVARVVAAKLSDALLRTEGVGTGSTVADSFVGDLGDTLALWSDLDRADQHRVYLLILLLSGRSWSPGHLHADAEQALAKIVDAIDEWGGMTLDRDIQVVSDILDDDDYALGSDYDYAADAGTPGRPLHRVRIVEQPVEDDEPGKSAVQPQSEPEHPYNEGRSAGE